MGQKLLFWPFSHFMELLFIFLDISDYSLSRNKGPPATFLKLVNIEGEDKARLLQVWLVSGGVGKTLKIFIILPIISFRGIFMHGKNQTFL